MTYADLMDFQIIKYCQQFDLHVDWLKNGWENQTPAIQALYEASNPHHAQLLKNRQGYGDLEISVGTIIPYPDEPIIISVGKTCAVDSLLVNSASFYEGQVRRSTDLGLPDYHFEPFNTVARNKKELKAGIKEYGKYLHEKYSGNYGKICIKYY